MKIKFLQRSLTRIFTWDTKNPHNSSEIMRIRAFQLNLDWFYSRGFRYRKNSQIRNCVLYAYISLISTVYEFTMQLLLSELIRCLLFLIQLFGLFKSENLNSC